MGGIVALNILLKGFVSARGGSAFGGKKGFGGGYVSFIVKAVSFIVLRLKAKPTSKNRLNYIVSSVTFIYHSGGVEAPPLPFNYLKCPT